MRRWHLFLLLSLFFLGALALAGVDGLYRWQIKPLVESQHGVQQQFIDLYLEDLNFLQKFELFRGKKNGTSDAGPYLNAHLYWSPLPEQSKFQHKPLVPGDVRETILRLGGTWMTRHKKATKANVDLSVFSELMKYDHWNIEANSPIGDLIKQKAYATSVELPTPETLDLLMAAKLRLMRGASEPTPLNSLQEVRQMVRLLLSTENMQLVLAGVAMLDDERRAYRYLVDRNLIQAESWSPIDRNTTRRAHRAIWGTRGYLHLWTQPEILTRVYLEKRQPVAFCAAVNDALPIEFSVRPLLEPQWPLEVSYKAEYALLDRIFERALQNCRLLYLSTLKSEDKFDTELPGPLLLNRLPYARKLFGLKMSALNSMGFESYLAINKPVAQ